MCAQVLPAGCGRGGPDHDVASTDTDNGLRQVVQKSEATRARCQDEWRKERVEYWKFENWNRRQPPVTLLGRCLSWKSAQPQFDLSRSRRILPNPNPTSAFFPIFKARGLLQAETEYAADTATIFRAMQPLAKATRTYSRQTTWFTLENNQMKSTHLNRFRMRNAILLVLIKQDLRREV